LQPGRNIDPLPCRPAIIRSQYLAICVNETRTSVHPGEALYLRRCRELSDGRRTLQPTERQPGKGILRRSRYRKDENEKNEMKTCV
jgi:hypothetical protein